jgi:hypothetical protein
MSSSKSIADRTEAIYRELKSLRWRFRIGSWITLIVGGLLLLLVAGYFWYGYSQIKELKDPEYIVSLVGQSVDEQLPIVRRRLEEEVKKNATTWAEQASQHVLEAIPQGREQLEQLALRESDKIIDQINVVGEKEFRRILDENRRTMQDAIQQLKNEEDVSEEIVLALQQAVEKELQIDAVNHADVVLTIVTDLNKNMGELLAGKDLTPEQKAERRVLMLAKRFQAEHFGEIKLDKVLLPVGDAIIGDLEKNRAANEAAKPTPKPAAKPKEAAKPAEKPKEAAKPAAKPKEAAKPAEKPKEAAKPAEKKDVPAEKKPAAKQ